MLGLVLALGLLFPKPPPEPPQAISRLLTLQEVQTLVYSSADRHGANKAELLQTVLCEAEKTTVEGEVRYVANGQSKHSLSYGREQSYGLAMFHIPAQNRGVDGEIITEKTAKDPIYALDSMALYFSQKKQSLWSCWNNAHSPS